MEVNITTRFNPGDKVYLLHNGRPMVTLVESVSVQQRTSQYRSAPEVTILYTLESTTFALKSLDRAYSEDHLFATAQELKDSIFAEIDKQ